MVRKKLEDVDRCKNLAKNRNFIWYLKQLAERREGIASEIAVGIDLMRTSLGRRELLEKQIEIKVLDDFITSPFALIELDELERESLEEESEG